MSEKQKNERLYGVDLFRIVSMLMVIMLHVLGHGGLLYKVKPGSVGYWTLWLLEIGSFCAVDAYALISGYIGWNRKTKYSGIFMQWLRVAFYSVLIVGLFGVFDLSPEVTRKTLLDAFFPITNQTYWFFSAYFFVILVSPFLNKAIEALEKKQCILLLTTLLIFFSVIPTLADKDPARIGHGYHFAWLMLLYAVGGCIAKFDLLSKWKGLGGLLLYGGSVLFTWLVKFVLETFPVPVLRGRIAPDVFVLYTSPTITFSAIGLLLFFIRFNRMPKAVKKCIGIIAPSAFSVYLIHDHVLVRESAIAWLGAYLGRFPGIQLILGIFVGVLAVFLICIAIDLMRDFLFRILKLKELVQKLENKLIGKIW